MTPLEKSFLTNISSDRTKIDKDQDPWIQKLDQYGRAYATGKRKDAVARVWVKPGTGKITVNDKDFTAYFARPVLQMVLRQPIVAAERDGQFDIVATVAGGSLSGQAGAVRHGISRALTFYEPGLRPVLKKAGFLTRDRQAIARGKYRSVEARRTFSFERRMHRSDPTPQREGSINPPTKAPILPSGDTPLHELAALSGKELVLEMKTWSDVDDGVVRLGKFLGQIMKQN